MTVITLDARTARLKRALREHFKELGFTRGPNGEFLPPQGGKDTYRRLHEGQRRDKLKLHGDFLASKAPQLMQYFADGGDVVPERISPKLEVVEAQTWQSDLFRLATLSWQIPVSDGYGRRIRFLVWDDSNNKLIGVIALGDAVFNLKARDSHIGWDHKDRSKRMANVMDAYVLGAVPPYNQLLGGKLVACLIRTQEVASHFRKKYRARKGLISKKKKDARLVLVTTTSALGRSSVYNRLRLGDVWHFKPIGFTGGWGHFHISNELFTQIRAYLRVRRHRYAKNHKFGNGPNWRLRAVRKAFDLLGMSQELMKHRLTREVFVCELASNAAKYLRGDNKKARFKKLPSVESVAQLARDRWLIPRAARKPDYVHWRKEQLLAGIQIAAPSQPSHAIGDR